jgi:hypothetical protein
VHDALLDMNLARDELLTTIENVGREDWQRLVPYGSRSLHGLLAHLAGADQAWAAAAQGLLKGEAEERPPLSDGEAAAVRDRAIERGLARTPPELLDEMQSRRRLLVGLYELLEPRHLALPLPSYGAQHNSAREHIWRGWHDRRHAADVRRALRMTWHPPTLQFVPDVVRAATWLSADPTLYVIYSVDAVLWERPSPVPGWSYRELMSHIATGDWVFQAHLRHIVEHGVVGPWPDIDAGNQQWILERQHSTVGALIEEYLSMRHETGLLLARLQPQHLRLQIEFWWQPTPNTHTVLEYVAAFGRHELAHRDQLRPAMTFATARGGA